MNERNAVIAGGNERAARSKSVKNLVLNKNYSF